MKKKKATKRKWHTAFRGYPVGTIAFYGPDDTCASKVVVGFIEYENAPTVLKTWFAVNLDVRYDQRIGDEIADYLKERNVRSISALERIMGCPHQEGIDYPEGQHCPQCPFWIGRDRFTGESIN